MHMILDLNFSKNKELKGLQDRGTLGLLDARKVPPDTNILGGRFVFAIKVADTEKQTWKARIVVQGSRDRSKTSLVHGNSNACF